MRSTTIGRLAVIRRARRHSGVWFEAVGTGHRVRVDVPTSDPGAPTERQLKLLANIEALLQRLSHACQADVLSSDS